MPNHPFYHTDTWRKLRQAALERDGYTCVVPGCRKRATHVDHIKRRQDGGTDTLPNMRSLCATHDNQIKEGAGGERRSNGRLTVKGAATDGSPIDPQHPWNTSPK